MDLLAMARRLQLKLHPPDVHGTEHPEAVQATVQPVVTHGTLHERLELLLLVWELLQNPLLQSVPFQILLLQYDDATLHDEFA
jgi:hypothetical protein